MNQRSRSEFRRDARSWRLLPPETLAGFIIAVLAVVLIAFFTYRSLRTREVAAARITQTLDAIQRLEALHSELKDAETGQRGFLLTGAERYLEPYTAARAALTGAFAPLRQQIGDDAAQRQRLDELERLA